MTSVVFAVYPIVLIVALLLFGGVADHIGRRAAILLGLVAALLGAVLFAAAQDVSWILVGRAFMGIGVALSLGPASAAMVEFSAAGRAQRAGSITTAVTAVGVALAMLVGGALVEYAPWPLRLNYVVLAAVIALVILAAWFLPRHAVTETRQRWRPTPVAVPRGHRLTFATAAIAVACSFILGTVVLSLGAQIAHQLAGSDNAFVTGLLLSVFAFTIIAAALVFARTSVHAVIALGGLVSVVGIGLYALTGATHSLALFFVASAVGGVGYSLSFMGGLALINQYAPAHHRAGMFSAAYLVGYLAQGIAAPTLGALDTAYGLSTALDVGAPVMAAVFVTAVVLSIRTRPSRRASDGGSAPLDAAEPQTSPLTR